jgi:hypothetical protein
MTELAKAHRRAQHDHHAMSGKLPLWPAEGNLAQDILIKGGAEPI